MCSERRFRFCDGDLGLEKRLELPAHPQYAIQRCAAARLAKDGFDQLRRYLAFDGQSFGPLERFDCGGRRRTAEAIRQACIVAERIEERLEVAHALLCTAPGNQNAYRDLLLVGCDGRGAFVGHGDFNCALVELPDRRPQGDVRQGRSLRSRLAWLEKHFARDLDRGDLPIRYDHMHAVARHLEQARREFARQPHATVRSRIIRYMV